MNEHVVVYGASGFTGGLISHELTRLKIPVVLAGRDRARLKALAATVRPRDIRVATVHDRESLAHAFDRAAVVVNCAGPFLKFGEPVVAATIAAGAHYLDITGEQHFVRDMYERYESLARKANVVLCNACAFEVAIADWGADMAARAMGRRPDPLADDDMDTLDEITVAYAWDHLTTTRGTQLSMIESLSAPGCRWEDDRWETVSPGSEQREFSFPAPHGARPALSFPSPEVITIPRHLGVKRVQTFAAPSHDSPILRMLTGTAKLMSATIPSVLKSPLGVLAKARIRNGPRIQSPEQTLFSVLVEARRNAEKSRVVISGNNVYGLSAKIVGEAVTALLSKTKQPRGAVTPAQLLDGRSTLKRLASHHELSIASDAP